jgi:hypothetical protein
MEGAVARHIPWKTVAVGGVLAAGALGAASLISTRSSASTAKPPGRTALIGDSYAEGLGPELAKLLPDFRFEGHTGTSTAQWVRHAPACAQCGDWLTTFKPELTLVSLGVNDGSRPDTADFQAIVRALHGIGTRVLWIEPPAAVRTPARAVIESLGVQFVPGTATALASDGLHPKSYKGWAEEIARAVNRG